MKPVHAVILLCFLGSLLLQSQCSPTAKGDVKDANDEDDIENAAQQKTDDDEKTTKEKEIEIMEAGILDSIQKFFNSDDPESGVTKISDYVKRFGVVLKDLVTRAVSGINGLIKGLSNKEDSDGEKEEVATISTEMEGSR
ncbi:uncharacterized protein LOC106470175 [Limulus polyphemus]|uniref:Uncharacterized protein LOC106470175 n=1 Tax=Limulus polyphemus TaxID=6850 RepID=A0ABM1BPI0_LIMPO|nr:uncharacterized protein LOC106470175 [Limulus polyphemus]